MGVGGCMCGRVKTEVPMPPGSRLLAGVVLPVAQAFPPASLQLLVVELLRPIRRVLGRDNEAQPFIVVSGLRAVVVSREAAR